MLLFFRALFSTDFVPHLYCLRGDRGLLWLHVVSDLAIAAAHFAIPIALASVALKRRDPSYRRVVWLFALLIVSSGVAHLLAVWTIWVPMYWLEGVVKALTAALSVSIVMVMFERRTYLGEVPSFQEMQALIESRLRVEQAVHVSDQRFENFVESVEDYAIYAMDQQGIVQTWNHGAERMKGYSAEEVIGKSFAQFYTVQDQESGKPQEALRIAVSEGRFESEGWRVRKDGTQFLANVVLRPLLDRDGALCGFSKVTRDLTESREMESKYQLLLEGAPDAIVIVDKPGAIQFINSQAVKLFGYAREEVLGKSIDVLVPPLARHGPESYRNQLFEGVLHPPAAMPQEILGMRKDGTEFPLEFSVSPLDTKNGPVHLFAVRDLTARQKMEKRFRDLLEMAPDAMVIVNGRGLIEVANLQSEKLFGYSRQELVGQPVDMLLPKDLDALHDLNRDGYFQVPEKRDMGAGMDLLAVRKDASEFPVEISLSPLEGPDGFSVIAAIRDITERKAATQLLAKKMLELRHSNEALEQFAHIASHDLQEPLRMVSSYVQLLAKRYKDKLDSDADDFIGFAVDGTRRMKQLIEDLLVYSKVGEKGLLRHDTSSEAALLTALEDLRASIEDSGATVTHDPLPMVYSAGSQLVQVFQNLIGNALKYKGSRVPKIHIAAKSQSNELVFSVRDNGIGIAKEHYERIFQIFQRLHGREDYEGTGIGLAICQRILSQQGGRIWVDSMPGQGSTFYFTLPGKG